ncbi:restriction endonuclease subunit S [Salinisphaera sp. Q1T1-3]|uniref:restriction endonuclease subunit S n=1 Tax=Salinisphaera sp. Q1T1-3 TaxID=2321229 RepID=UPI000E76D879|nr:restriction endonuclease subunit S [Salinisphaera sp. Q1T1-3]RJS91145.1 restriction endonuclease subunit S [Salinisphaera sp. Q1T1-3]
MSGESSSPDARTQRRLRFDMRVNPVKSELELPPETEVSFVSMDAVGSLGGLRLDDIRPLADVYDGYTYFRDGDVCVAKITPCFENGKGALASGLANGVAFGTTELHVLRPRPTLDAKFLFYLSMSHEFRSRGESEMLGAGGQKRVPEVFLKDFRPTLPPLEEQRRITELLDEKTARIDALIEKKRALLDRLAENRQALITRSVTKGLNSDAPMKLSSIDWLGEIPSHWQVRPLKRVAKLESGHTPDRKIESYWENCTIPWVSLNDTDALRQNDYISSTAFNINEQGLANSSARLLPAKAVVFTRDATIGESAITTCPMAVSQHLIAWLCNEGRVLPEFLLAVIYGMTGELKKLTNGSTISTIGLADVKSIRVALPPVEEQRDIVEFVFSEIEKIASIAAKVRTSIEQLSEYRDALISAAVTGNIRSLNS